MATSFWIDLPVETVVVSGTVTVAGTITANQGTTPWNENVAQFGGANVVTGVGNSGAGIPRVTVSSDSNLNNISGTISLPTGASTLAAQTTHDNRFFSTTSAITQVASSASNVTLLASNSARKGAVFFNESSQSCYVKLGTTASSASYTIKMEPLSTIIINNDPVYTGNIDGIWDSANGVMAVTELT